MQESQPGRSYPNMGFDLQKDRGHENQASNFDRASHEHFSVMSTTMLFLHAFCLNISINIHTSIHIYIHIDIAFMVQQSRKLETFSVPQTTNHF